jgi:hypothetical protein
MNNSCFIFNDTRYVFDLKSGIIKGVVNKNNLLTKLTKLTRDQIKNINLSDAFLNLNRDIINEQVNRENIISGNDEQVDRNIDLSNFKYVKNYC